MQKRLIFLLIVLFSCVSFAGCRDSQPEEKETIILSTDVSVAQPLAGVDVLSVDFFVDGKKLMITVPLKNLGLSNYSLDLEFKWSDNMQVDDDPLDWYVNGDAAPGARFNYIYSV